MSRQKGRTSNSVSLFPFLAVLVCAMGALIFLLLVTTRRIRHNAVLDAIVTAEIGPEQPLILPVDVPLAEAEPEIIEPHVPEPSAVMAPVPEPVAEPRPDPNARLHELIAALSQRRDDEQRRLDDRRKQVTAAKSRLAQADGKLSRLTLSLKSMQEERLTASVNRQVVRAEFTRLGEEIDEAKVALRRVEQQNADRSTKYAVVPFDGQSGTTRRPILIECTKDGLTFLEENITLTAADLDGFTVEYNPLLAGTQALVQHWRAQNRQTKNREADSEPYVLLIVRPSGSIAYYAARKLLSELSQPSGYELVQDGVELDVPPHDAQASQACRNAIQTVLNERRKVVEALAAAGERDGILRFRRGPGGLEPVEPEPSIFDRAGKRGFGERSENPRGWTGRGGAGEGPERDGFGPAGGASREERVSSFANSRGDGSAGRGTGATAGESQGRFSSGRPTDGGARGAQGNDGGGGVGGGSRLTQDASRGDGRSPGGAYRPSSFGGAGGGEAGTEFRGQGSGDRGQESGDNAHGPRPVGDAAAQPGNAGSPGSPGAPGAAGSPGGPNSSGVDGQPPIPLRTFGNRPEERDAPRWLDRSKRAWGTGTVRNGIGFERETAVYVSAERIRVGTQPEIRLDQFETTNQMIERVLDDLDRHARIWGRPPENFHWVPVVRFLVSPGGNLHYERLHGPLRRVGIGSTVEYPLE